MLKEMFDGYGIIFAPSSGTLAGHLLQKDDCVLIPSAEGLYDEGLKLDAFSSTVFEMSSVLGLFPRFYGRRWDFGSTKEGSVLSGGDDADVEGHFGAVNPISDEDVGGP